MQQQPAPSPVLPQHPAAISLNMAPDAPEDAALVSRSLVELQQLWGEWHGFGPRNLPPQQVLHQQQRSQCAQSSWSLGVTNEDSLTSSLWKGLYDRCWWCLTRALCRLK